MILLFVCSIVERSFPDYKVRLVLLRYEAEGYRPINSIPCSSLLVTEGHLNGSVATHERYYVQVVFTGGTYVFKL